MSCKKEVLDFKASENEYLHRDFHGALCYAIKYLDDTYGTAVTTEYLEQVGRTVYMPLIESLRSEGLGALERHWKEIFEKETGKFAVSYDNDTLVLKVTECPAISHLKKINQLFTSRYCQTTVVVNQTICKEAGFACSCAYEPGEGKCVQKFWQVKEKK